MPLVVVLVLALVRGGGLADRCSGHQSYVFSGCDVNSVSSGNHVAGVATRVAHSDATLHSDQ